MNRKSFILTLSVMTTLFWMFTACSKDLDGIDTERTTTLTLTSQMAATRGINTSIQSTQIANGVQVGVFATAGDINNHVLTANGDGAFTGGAMTIPTSTSLIDVYAYAPYQSGWTSDTANTFSVQTDQSSDESYLASDLLWGSKTGVSVVTDAAANIIFVHKLSKVKVVITKKSGANLTLTGATVSIVDIKVSSTLKPSDGTLGEASGDAQNILMATLNSESTATIGAIVVPQTIAENSPFLKIVLNNSKIFYVKLNTSVTFQSGKSYVLGVELGTTDSNTITVSVMEGSEISGLLG